MATNSSLSSVSPQLPLVAIVGPTASGKTALAIELAQKYNGEIICADSRTVYKGMDVGTAKPTAQEQSLAPHWGLDLVEPGERFTAADFQRYAVRKIAEIRARGRLPILVGGTGLYVDAVLFDYQLGAEYDPELRERLDGMSIEELQEYCIKNSIELPENVKNKRHLIRAIEQKGVNSQRRLQPISRSIIVGITTDREVLRTRIAQRTEQIFANGVADEAIILGKKYGWSSEAMTGNIYPLVKKYTEGTMSLEEIKDKFTTLDWRLAKRQLTWLRRNPYIFWGDSLQIKAYVAERLQAMSSLE